MSQEPSDDLSIPSFLARTESNPQCSQCGARAEYGYKNEGAMRWYCEKHRPSQHYADARLPTVDDAAADLADRAEHIRQIWGCATKHLIEHVIIIGRNLVEAREICPHGEWLPWLKREFDWSQSTADRFIQVYRKRDELPTRGYFDFPLNGQYLLAAPSTPPEARQEMKARVEAGEKVSVAQVRETITKAKAPKSKPQPPSYIPADIIDKIVVLFKGLAPNDQNRCVRRLSGILRGESS